MTGTIVNKVAESGIITVNLEDFYIADEAIVVFDLKDFLFMGLILKEKDYRAALQNVDWNVYTNKVVAIQCTADAIIPMWAYMLATTYLTPVCKFVAFGTIKEVANQFLLMGIENMNATDFTDKRIVIKGCGDVAIPEIAYTAVTRKLLPFAKSIMYGEPCSTVPLYKKKI